MIFLLFGKPGAGKNFVGDVISKNFDFYHYDADKDLPDYLIKKIKTNQLATDEERMDFYNIVIDKINFLKKTQQNIVVSQATIKEKFRQLLIDKFPEIKFVYVRADSDIAAKRLLKRKHFVSKKYADDLEALFEEPRLEHFILNNNYGKKEIIDQFKKILNKITYDQAI